VVASILAGWGLIGGRDMDDFSSLELCRLWKRRQRLEVDEELIVMIMMMDFIQNQVLFLLLQTRALVSAIDLVGVTLRIQGTGLSLLCAAQAPKATSSLPLVKKELALPRSTTVEFET
jgi:hypothetical protein